MKKRKTSAGFFFSVLVVIAAVVGLAFYMINCNTSYFRNLGINPLIIGSLVCAILLEVLYIIVEKDSTTSIVDIFPAIVSALLMVGAGFFVASRAAGAASIMTFEGNAQTLADLQSAIIGIAAILCGVVISWIAAFMDVSKPVEE